MKTQATATRFIGDLLPQGVYRAILNTKPLMAVVPSIEREEIAAGVIALRMTAGAALEDAGAGVMALAELTMWIRLLPMLPSPASALDGPSGRNALCGYLAEKINDVWRTRPELIETPHGWPLAGMSERVTLTLAECCSRFGVLPHPEVLDPTVREILRSQIAQPGSLKLAREHAHYFVIHFAAGTSAGADAVAAAFTDCESLRLLSAGAIGRLATGQTSKFGGAEGSINARCAADLLRMLADAGVTTPESQIGWAFDEQPGRLTVLTALAGRAIDVALSMRPVVCLPDVIRQSARLIGYDGTWGPAASAPSLALDYCGAMARELLDRALARWPTDQGGKPILDPARNAPLAQLLRRHDSTPSLLEQYVDLLIAGGIAPGNVAIPPGPAIYGTTYGPVDAPLTFRDVFNATLPSSCLGQFEARYREACMSKAIATASQDRCVAPAARRRIRV